MEKKPIRVLHIEDNPNDILLVQRLLKQGPPGVFQLESSSRVDKALERLKAGEIDLILIDLGLPDGEGIGTVARLRLEAPDVPIIALTGILGESMGIKAIKAGAVDYLIKDKLNYPLLASLLQKAVARPRPPGKSHFEKDSLSSIHALVIENVDEDFFLLQRVLKQVGDGRFHLERVGRLDEGLKRLAQGGIDIVLTDLNLPDAQEMDCVIRCFRQNPDVPILAVTGSYQEGRGIEALQAGAQGYILKDKMDGRLLKREIEYATERVRCYKTLAELNQFKDTIVATVSHELRTPLSILKAAIGNLKDGVVGSLSDQQRRVAEIADQNIGRLEKVVEGLLDLFRLESGKQVLQLRSIDAASLVSALVTELCSVASERHLVIKTDLCKNLPAIPADPDLLTEVLLNLFNNALRFSKSTIEMKVGMENDAAGGKKSIQISVIDDGPGIPKERLQTIFEKFNQIERTAGTRGYKGTGLGLAICKEIVEQHQGRIWAESELGQGAQFHFTVPII